MQSLKKFDLWFQVWREELGEFSLILVTRSGLNVALICIISCLNNSQKPEEQLIRIM